MRIEQLTALNVMFKQLEELQRLLIKYEQGRVKVGAWVDGFTVENEVFNKIANKHAVNIIEELKEEIKKREEKIENISILQLNKLV